MIFSKVFISKTESKEKLRYTLALKSEEIAIAKTKPQVTQQSDPFVLIIIVQH